MTRFHLYYNRGEREEDNIRILNNVKNLASHARLFTLAKIIIIIKYYYINSFFFTNLTDNGQGILYPVVIPKVTYYCQ